MTKKESKEKRIKDIIQAAVDEFLENGYEGTSMEAIARRAGISKGGLYHHFNSKDEILIQANQKLNEPVSLIMQKAVSKKSAREGLVWYIRNYLEYWATHEKELFFYGLSTTKMLDCQELWQMYGNYSEANISFLQGFFERGIIEGEFIPHLTYESAVALMASLDGIIFYLVIDKKMDLDTIINIFQKKFVDFFLAGRRRTDNSENE